MMFWVPQTGDIGLGISILSYDGGVQFSLVTDKKLCARPQEIIDRFLPEFEKLLYAVLLAPWDDEVDPRISERSLAATESLAQAAGHLAGEQAAAAASGPGNGEAKAQSNAAEALASRAPGAQPAAAEETAPGAGAKPPRRKRSAFAAARAAARG
jgi:hypothetical protein